LHTLFSFSMNLRGPQSDLQALQNSVLTTDADVHILLESMYDPAVNAEQQGSPRKIASTLAASNGLSYRRKSDKLPWKNEPWKAVPNPR
jgi:hypothetical protein